ncbi:ABC transporter substrate-binding protein [Luteimicrobium xylanilyticum]|uniref:Putative D,D-dipeptide-binding periplasmic protein DdpA n=1 Tax=Luteimicrobium xylanilyticum TaxID=1133546 RepID=A0A5P9QGP8_9MICO|nr:ABC transporter substrate-binding protein [Luteimicrobium xylanilyticum]QFU99625.1 putative D,D-dipeptide-binding periplasmic protein DdpA [Luteimicrobium xylanilyticum]
MNHRHTRPSPRSLRRPAALLATATALTLALAACSGGSSGAGTTASDGGTPVDGGALSFAIQNDPISLNPSGTGSGNDTLYVTRQLVDSLLYQDPKDGSLQPWLASKWTASDDAKKFTFTIRDGVTFSDGTPLTAQSVKDTFDDIVKNGAKALNAVTAFVGLDKIVAKGSTVEVDFSTPNAAFPQATTAVGLGILAESTLKTPYDERTDGSKIVGSGPYTLDRYTKNVETVLKKRAGYTWAPAAFDNTTGAHLDTVTFKVVPEAGVRTGTLTSGQSDVIGGVQPNDVSQLEGAGLPLVYRANPGLVFGLTFNEASPFGSDPELRKAVALAVDPKEVRDTALDDKFAVATSPLGATTPGYADVSKNIVTDVDQAKQVLDADGWKPGADGIRTKDGKQLTFTIEWISNFAPNQTALELIQQQLKAVGIAAKLETGAVPEFLATLQKGDYDAAWGNSSRADGDILRTSFSTAATDYYRIDDPTLERLLQKQLATGDPTKRDAVLAQIQERLVTQHHEVPVHELTSIIGTQKDVHGVALGADSRLDLLVDAWKAK